MQVQKAYKIRFSKFSVDLLTWNRIRIQTKSKSHIIINLLMQIFHLNLFFAGQDFSTPYMADDLDLPLESLHYSLEMEGFLFLHVKSKN